MAELKFPSMEQFDAGNSTEWKKNFRELPPTNIWGANIEVEGSVENFKAAIIKESVSSGKSYFGYFIHPQKGTPVYHLSKYPRPKYGVPSDDEMRQRLDPLLDNYKGQQEGIRTYPIFRIVLGLEEGYGTGVFRTLPEAKALLGNQFTLSPAEIFTVQPKDGVPEVYQEPAVCITGKLTKIRVVYEVAEKLKQERFVVENFASKTACIVETRLCTDPDV